MALLTARLMPPAVAATVVLGPLALTRPWLAAVDRDLQRLPDKIISRCFGAAEHRDDHSHLHMRSGSARAGPPVAA
jgi:hypothetical protein